MRTQTRTGKAPGTMNYRGFTWKPFINVGGRGGAALYLHGKMWVPAETDPARIALAWKTIGR